MAIKVSQYFSPQLPQIIEQMLVTDFYVIHSNLYKTNVSKRIFFAHKKLEKPPSTKFLIIGASVLLSVPVAYVITVGQ